MHRRQLVQRGHDERMQRPQHKADRTETVTNGKYMKKRNSRTNTVTTITTAEGYIW